MENIGHVKVADGHGGSIIKNLLGSDLAKEGVADLTLSDLYRWQEVLDVPLEELLVDLHHEHKRRNDYSELEISRKRAALENVLVPETVSTHKQRLGNAGFSHSAVWLRYFNFVSIVAIK